MRFRKIIHSIAAVVTALFVTGCDEDKPTEVNRSELEQLLNSPRGAYSTMWRGTFYCGTSGDFHFLRHTIEMKRDLHLKIKTNDLPIQVVGKYPLDKSKWIEISSLVLTNAPGQSKP